VEIIMDEFDWKIPARDSAFRDMDTKAGKPSMWRRLLFLVLGLPPKADS
jgi:hypothetical protein